LAGSDLYTGTLDTLILKALSWGSMHGYGIGRWIRQTTDEELEINEGALYPALHRMQKKGWLEEQWGVTETNREAKFYSLTPEGRSQLTSEIARWKRYANAVTAALSATVATPA
jgi:transcriptional regulator